MEENKTTYIVRYWYDNSDQENPYEYKLGNEFKYEGTVGQVIETVPDIMADLYYKSSSNLPFTLGYNESKNIINIYYSSAYRNYIYNMAKNSITEALVTEDLKVFLKLMGLMYGDLYQISKNVDDSINVDYVDEEHLRHLAKLIGYEWVEALTADEQRESIKFYMYLRRMRGTSFGLKNLIRIFGQTMTSLYQASDNTGVRVMEYKEGNSYGMFPGDIRIEIPELSKILRQAANDVKLMGTRLIFAYRIDIGTTNEDKYGHIRGYYPAPGVTGNIHMWIQPGLKGWDKSQEIDQAANKDKKFIYKYVDTYNVHGSTELKPSYSEPFTNMWIFQEKGLENIRGVVLDDGVIGEDLYLYK